MPPLPLPAESGVSLAILGELASGGMGRVDLARVVGDYDHVVAVKRLHPHLARDQHFVEMFLDEVRVTGSLRHPNVVELVGWGRDEEGIFLAMEFVHGAPLSHVARTGRSAGEPMPAELIAFVGSKIAAGLAGAHDLRGVDGELLGLIHRDVTPSNVLLAFDGAVKLTDFGVAKATGSSTHTATGVLKGKVSYMSPEYAKAKGFDRRSDLYSTAVVLFELATGVRPFTADHDLELLRLIAEVEPPPIAAFVPGFNKGLAELIHRMLAKDPSARPASGHEVAAELDRWLASRGYGAAGLERTLAAYVERHAADRKMEVARLLEAPGELAEDRARTVRRTRTVTLLVGSESMPPGMFDTRLRIREEDKKEARSRERADPKTRAISRPPPEPLVPAELVTGDDVSTEPLTRKVDLGRAPPNPAVDDETDTGLVAPRAGSAASPVLPPPAPTRLVAAGLASFLIVTCALVAVLALTRKRAPDAQASGTPPPPPVSAAPVASETAPTPPEPPPAPSAAPPEAATSAAPAGSSAGRVGRPVGIPQAPLHAGGLRLSALSTEAALKNRLAGIGAIAVVATISREPAAAGTPFRCPAHAPDAATAERLARQLFDDAVSREPADPEGALERLRCAQAESDRPAIALRIGTIAERLGQDRLALDAFERYLRLAGRDAPDAADMRRHIESLRQKLQSESPPVAPATVPPPPDPTAKRAVAAAPVPGEADVSRILGWAMAGTGLLLAGAGAVLLIDARSKNDEVHSIPPGTTSWTSDQARGTYEAARTEQTLGIVGLCAGALITATGLFVALRPRSDPASPAQAGRARSWPATLEWDF